MNEIIMKLKDKDDKAAYEYSKIIGAESAESDKYLPMLPEFADMLYDLKPTVVRQCLHALHEVALYRPEMYEMIIDAVDKIEVSKYKDSMSPIIDKDINELMKVLG